MRVAKETTVYTLWIQINMLQLYLSSILVIGNSLYGLQMNTGNMTTINLRLWWYFNIYCIYVSDFPQNRNWPHTRAVRTESGTMRRKELKRSLDHKRSHSHCRTDPIQLCSKPIISAPLAFQTTPKAKKKRLYYYMTILYYINEHWSFVVLHNLSFWTI